MALPLRRLAGLLVIAAALGCPKAVNAPDAKVAPVGSGVQIGQVVRLDASGSVDAQGRDLSFAWQFTAIPIGSTATLNDAHSATPSFLADVNGEYDVQVVVSNAFVSAAAVTTKVMVSDCGGRAPVFGTSGVTARDAARPTTTGNFAVGATVVLASDVSDPDNSSTDGVCTASQNQALTYSWKLIGQPAASAAALNNATASSPSFVADVAGSYTVRLVATDSTNRSSVPFDQTFTVSTCGSNAPTVASVAPVTEQLAVGMTIQMTATPDDADNSTACQAVLGALQTFSYQWSLPQLPNGSRASLNSAVAQNPSFAPDIDGDYVVRLVVTDSTGRSSTPKDTGIHIPKCGNNAPVATITSASGGAAPSAGFLGILLQFGETVQDLDQQAIGSTPAACTPPIPQSFTLRWSILALPAGSAAQLNNPTGTNPSFTPDVAGTYTLQLVATDQSGLSSVPATQSVAVKACGLTPPTITSIDTAPTAGATTVNSGTSVGVKAVASDPDNSTGSTGCNLPVPQTLTYAWSLASKPSGSAAFITNPSQDPTVAPATFVPDVANGTYQVQLVVTDSTGLKSAPGFFSVFTNSCGTNPPVILTASAGSTLPDPGTVVTLTATGQDPDNGSKCSPALSSPQTLSYRWTLVSRPSGSGTALSTTATDGSVSTFTPDVIGPYQFSVVVTDSTGLHSAASFVTVQTSQCGSHAPVINTATATPPAGITQPRPTLDAVALSGTVSDADDACFGGTQPKTFSWTVSSRPAGSSAVISSSTSLTAASFTPDVPGAYQFRLDVTDSLGLKAAPAFASVTADSCSVAAPQVTSFNAGTLALGGTVSATQFGLITLPTAAVTANNCLAAGATFSYAWSTVAAPAGTSATLSNPAVATPTFTPDKVGNYQFALTVTNGLGIASAPVFLNIAAATCGNASLGWASIGVTQIVDPDAGSLTLPATPSTGATVTVSAVASDGNGACGSHVQPISYRWAIVAAPAGSHAALTSATAASPAFVPDVANGAYQLSVVATDALGNTSSAPNFITVSSSSCGANVPTVVVSPQDLSSASPSGGIFSMTPTTLVVTATSADTTSCTTRFHIASSAYTYAWTINSQPVGGRASLSTASGASTSFDAFESGVYSVHVVATAPTGVLSNPNAASSYVAINAKPCGSYAPVVNSISTFASGTSNPLSRPSVGQAVDLIANATDLNTTCGGSTSTGISVTSYAWTAVLLPSGSVAPSMFTASSGKLTLTPDVAGTFTYSVVATDSVGLQSVPVQVSIDTAACGPIFAGVRAASSGSFLPIDSTNTVQGMKGTALSFDLPPTVAQTGSGTGGVAVSGTPSAAYPVVVKIVSGGATGTATFALSTDGGSTFAAAATTAASVAAGATGTTLAFTTGTFNAGDTYSYATRIGGYLPNDVCVRSPSYAYAWSLTRPSTSQATLSTLAGASPQFTPDVVGTYAVQLVVTDNAGLVSSRATLTVNAANCGSSIPVITSISGPSTPPNAGALVTLSTTGITDSNTCGVYTATPYSYSWSLISRPTGSSATLSSQTSATPQFVTDLPNGLYQVALTVTDALGNVSAPAFASITSSSCGAYAPVIGSLVVTTAQLNANSPLALSAVATDADNTCTGFFTTVTGISWSIVSAPTGSRSSLVSSATVPVSNGATPPSFNDGNTFQANATGSYVVQAIATASNGLKSAPKTVSLSVAPTGCGTNAPLITQVSATDTSVSGSPSTSRPPVGDNVALTVSHTDADESLSVCNPVSAQPTYLWTLVSAPTGSAQKAPSGPQSINSMTFKADLAGTFVWSVVATDPFGLSSAPVSVTVATGSCGPAVANATGVNEAIKAAGTGVAELGTPPGYTATQGTAVTLSTGAISDACVSGGAAPTLSWSLSSVPAGSNAVLSTKTGATPAFTADLAGTYGIQLVVTDNGGNSSVYTTNLQAGACTSGPQIVNSTTQPLVAAAMYTDAGNLGATIYRGDVIKLALPLAATAQGGLLLGACSAVTTYQWSMIGKPSGSAAALSSTTDATPSFAADVASGSWQFALVVRDGLNNASAPFFFSLTSSGCGTFPPTFGSSPAIGFSASPRANAPIALTAPTAADGNASCPTGRGFQATPITYAFSMVNAPAGAQTSISQNGSTGATLQVNLGGNYTAQVIATDANGRSTAAVQTAVPTVSNCGAYPPVTNAFTVSQAVPNTTPGTTTLGESPATGASLTTGGAAATATNYYFGFPIAVGTVPTTGVTDADFGATCSTFTIAAQTTSFTWSLIGAPAGSHLALGASNGGSVIFTPDLPGQYKLALTTTDSLGYASTSTLAIGSGALTGVVCGTNPPAITSGSITGTQPATGLVAPVQLVALGSAVQLNAAVTDPDTSTSAGSSTAPACAVAEAQPFTYQWSFLRVPAGSKATLPTANTLNASFTPDVAGQYALSFTATDPQGHSVTNTSLVVDAECGNIAPSVRLVGGATSGKPPDFTVAQTLSVNGGVANEQLVHGSDHLKNAATGVSATLDALYPGVPVQLAATVLGTSAFPILQTSCPNLVDTTITYQWSIAGQPAGSKATLNSPTAVSPSFTPDVPGVYDFQLILTDQNGRSSTNLLSVDDLGSVHPGFVGACGTHAPTAVASVTGPIPASSPANEPLGIRAQLDAAGSQSPDDYRSVVASVTQTYPNGCGLTLPLSYQWTITTAPAGSNAPLSSATLSNPSFSPDLAGLYTAQLTVTDALKNSATATATVKGVGGYTSTPATTGTVFTATTTDASGNPIVAFWDNSTGTVAAARCTSNCNTSTPSWSLVGGGNIDTGLSPMTLPTPEDEPRPIAAAFAAGNVYVAYYTSWTGTAANVTIGAHGMPTCGVALAIYNGFSWSYTAMTATAVPPSSAGPGATCNSTGTASLDSGRWLAVDANGSQPAVAFSVRTTSTGVEPHFRSCVGTTCGTVNSEVVIYSATSFEFGRWMNLHLDSSGAVATAFTYVAGTTSGVYNLVAPTLALANSSLPSANNFQFQPVDVANPSDNGRFVSMATNPAGTARYFAYRDFANHTARWTRCGLDSVGRCSSITGLALLPDPASSDYGRSTAVAFDNNGVPRISYVDVANSKVRVVAQDNTGAFNKTAEFSATTSPGGLSMSFGSGPFLNLAYDAPSVPSLRFFTGP